MEKSFEDKLVLKYGRTLHLTFHQANDSDMAEYLDWCKEEYARDPGMDNRLHLLYAQAEHDFAVTGDGYKAVNDLLVGLDEVIDKEIDSASCILIHMDTVSLLVEILLRLGRIDEAMVWGEKVYRIACTNFPGTVEIAYAQELYACCLYAAGRIDEAKDMFTEALDGIETEISEAEVLRDGIKANLKELKA